MPNDRIRLMWVLIAVVAILGSVAGGGDVYWLPGSASPAKWSIQPSEPGLTDVIQFSGPTGVYASQDLAQQAFGGQPVLEVDEVNRRIELRFVLSATGPVGALPMCGIKGSFGPLKDGEWQFFCAQGGATFTLYFDVKGPSNQHIYYVDARANGTGNGSSWVNAFVHLQDALAVAGPGSEIRVAQGVYRPDLGAGVKPRTPTATFVLKSGVNLKGGYAGVKGTNLHERDVADHESILSGDLLGNDDPNTGPLGLAGDVLESDNSLHVVTIARTDATAVLDGFTITGGHAFGSKWPDKPVYGGGIYLETASPFIRNCLIVANAAGYYGGGIYARDRCAPVLLECAIADNWSAVRGGGLYRDWGCDLRLERCLISGNVAGLDGGGIASNTDGGVTLANCILSGNVAAGPASGRGGALYGFLATARLNHCTFTGNSAPFGASIACTSSGEPGKCSVSVTNCILWDLGAVLWNEGRSVIQVDYSDVRGGTPGKGNIDIDPDFAAGGHWGPAGASRDPGDAAWRDGDYHLTWDSLCVDMGDPCEVVTSRDMDFAGRYRFSGRRVDMGAYELKNDPPIADAGPEVRGFSVTGDKGTVTLDASRSRDPEGRPLTYAWYRQDKLVSAQAKFTTDLPLGTHTFKLVVNDGTFDSPSDEVAVNISVPVSTKAFVSPAQMPRTGGSVIGLVALPKGRSAGDFDERKPVLLLPGHVKAVAQSIFPWIPGQLFILARFNRADLMAAVPTNGPVELKLVGQLKDGTYFAGADSVNIK